MRSFYIPIKLLLVVVSGLAGCCHDRNAFRFGRTDPCYAPGNDPSSCVQQLRLTDPFLCIDCGGGMPECMSPLDIDETALTGDRIIHLSLESCIREALNTSKVMRDLGGTVVRSPQTTTSTLDPALVYTDPRTGEEAVLSAFDASFFASNMFEANNRRFNNQFFGINGVFNQSLNTSQVGISKRSATGGLFTFRNVTIGDNNNQAGNQFGRQFWDSFFEAEVRQPLLQGAGSEFNRIAGPGSLPGQLNGVLLARTRTDINLVDFEKSVRDLVAEVENSYWDLYYAYRDLEAKIDIRDIAADTLKKRESRDDTSVGDKAQALEQLHRFQSEVVDALNGRPIDGTRTNNGSAGGTFRGSGGLRLAERKLRLMIGYPINDGRIIRPADSPSTVPIVYDWEQAVGDALRHREELKRQRWVIKQSQLELIANRNFLMPQLDIIGRYRARGYGDRLLSNSSGASFFDDDLQEVHAGLEYTLPVGFRRAHAAVRNSELALVRANEVLREQERFVTLGLSNAVNETKRSFENMNLQQLRLDAIVTQLKALEEREARGNTPELDVLLETHRRLLDARLRFHQAQIEYSLALRNVHFEKGTLLAYNSVFLAESLSPGKALEDASERIHYQDATVRTDSADPVIAQ